MTRPPTLLRNLLIAAVVLAVLAGLTFSLTRPKPIAVTVAAAEPGRVETTVANTRAGSVAACRRAKLAPPMGGRIDKLLVREGDRVKAGQVLVELWNDDLAARERISLEQRATAQAHVREACLVADNARRNAERTRALRAKGFVSEERVDQAESEAKARQAGCDSARAQVQEAQARIGASRADTARTVVKAPFDGIVAEVNGEVGEYLTPSPPGIPTLPAIDLIDDACLYVTAPIDEVDAAQLRVGMAGRISLDAYRGKHFTGKVRRIAPYVLALEKQARTVEVEVDFESPAEIRHLLVGYSADIEVVVDARDDVLRIPTSALMPGSRVLVLTEGGVLEERKVEAGLSNWEFTEAKGGLARGDRVVTSLERAGVKAGVRAVAEEKPAAKKP
ncbi:MAG: secretion protein HlyD [Rhodocyclaceae bacterium]|uniref:Efflux RND transporter periplasmic adaptor subunit n=1 Tax=Candidatus Desulfobacillus denitrificans TaxID=2608985 RepID=A0A809R1G2_9PROT|nr:efflux RND transporter periplasmic adaptor subunit [Candidatus Desulfobacillus denitrificans]GIK44156.1 MAG: secretion protein HlyD [Betaproteobacteria bacterium]GJQ55123.1 MAG: secretion protein HlyD [Rhodocyclaceae bacterium]